MTFVLSSYRWLILYSLHLCDKCIQTQMIWIVACKKLNLFCLQYNKCWVSKDYNVNIPLWCFTLLLYLSIFWFYLLKLCIKVSVYNKLHKNSDWSVLFLLGKFLELKVFAYVTGFRRFYLLVICDHKKIKLKNQNLNIKSYFFVLRKD